jgi:hypothetical protein
LALVTQVRDQVRTLLRIRRERSMPRVGLKPAVGARIVCGDLRMNVQAGMSDALWRWLTKQGWREVDFRPDRRRYRDIQHAFVTLLFDAHPDDWRQILASASEKATFRPHTLPGRRIRFESE